MIRALITEWLISGYLRNQIDHLISEAMETAIERAKVQLVQDITPYLKSVIKLRQFKIKRRLKGGDKK